MSFGITASSAVVSGVAGDSPYMTAVLSENPLVYLSLNETTGTVATDSSGNAHDGTYSNIVLNQYSYVTNSSGRSTRTDTTTGSVTVPFGSWMNTPAITALLVCCTGDGGISMLASRYATDSGPNSNSWFVDIGSGDTFVLYYRTNSGTDVLVDSGVSPQAGKRFFIAVYIGASESGIRVYADGGGLLGANTGAGGVINNSTADLMLYSSGAGYGIIGYIDDFALLGSALSTSRIDELAVLAVGTQFDWLTVTEGTAVRNGTASHTINFTPATAGSLLIAVMAGAVTHTAVTAGWTKQLSAINFTEIALFSMTAAGGESSLQVTHNASNYPVEWVVYEFPVGSTFVGGNAVNSGPFTSLSGLPGSNTTVFAAGSSPRASGELALTMNWFYFWKTEVNRNTLYDGATTGVFLNVGRFANNDFPDTTADVYNPATQFDYDLLNQKIMFAIQHP